jgi:hypothetical protein
MYRASTLSSVLQQEQQGTESRAALLEAATRIFDSGQSQSVQPSLQDDCASERAGAEPCAFYLPK